MRYLMLIFLVLALGCKKEPVKNEQPRLFPPGQPDPSIRKPTNPPPPPTIMPHELDGPNDKK
jgi:hypothetical protein